MNFPLLPFIAFAIAGSVTPGPNVLLVAAGAARNGVRATLPHIVGISCGFAVMILIVGAGLAVPLTAFPAVQVGMRWVGAAWIGWIAWQIATSPAPGEGPPRPPMSFLAAAMFQWVNPKAWLLAIGMTTAWTVPGESLLAQYALMAAIFGIFGAPCSLVWAVLGDQANRFLHRPRHVHVFNVTMAVLLVASMVPVLR
jgi:threonine/homoserine/homoserine lactone efflux protein